MSYNLNLNKIYLYFSTNRFFMSAETLTLPNIHQTYKTIFNLLSKTFLEVNDHSILLLIKKCQL